MREIIWRDPVPATRGVSAPRLVDAEFEEALKINTGKWAVLFENATTRRALPAYLDGKGYQSATRAEATDDKGNPLYTTYIRFVGVA